MPEMTPEKLRNGTPDNLKKLARLIEMGQPLRPVAVSQAIDLCVSAWEADRARIEALEKAGQFKRIEEDDEVVVGDYIFHMERMADDHIWYQIEGQAFDLYVKKGKLCWLPQTPHGWADLAALAAEEEKT
jgi:hypothetical protein